MSIWLKRLGISVLLLASMLAILCVFIRFQGIQYVAAYSGNGFARNLPAPDAYPVQGHGGTASCSTSQPINVLTYNVLYGSTFIEDMAARFRNGDTGGYLPWSQRFPEIRQRIASYAPDLIGLQETHTDTDIALIVPQDKYTLVTYHLGSFQYGDAALLFKTDRFSLLESGQLWLGPNPELPLAFGFRPLAMIRYVNWAVLREQASGFTFLFVNTHFDNSGANKEPSSTLFHDRIASLAKGMPIIVTGDFNSTAKTGRHRRFTGADQNPPLLRNAYMLANSPPVAAEVHPDSRIDHILAGGPCQVVADSWSIDQRPLENGQAMSDHDPVLASLRFMP